MEVRNRLVWMIVGAVGSDCGASKTARGGWAAIGNKVPEIPVWDETNDDGAINFYKDIDEYMDLRSSLEVGTDRFFLGVNPDAKNRRDFLRRQHLGKNAFMAVVKNVCMKEGIEGSGKKSWVTTHGLRGTLATLLFQEGPSDSSVALRTGHRDPRSLKRYQNLRSGEGQRDLLGCESESPRKAARRDAVPFKRQLESTLSNLIPAAHFGTVTGGTVNVTVNVFQSPENREKEH